MFVFHFYHLNKMSISAETFTRSILTARKKKKKLVIIVQFSTAPIVFRKVITLYLQITSLLRGSDGWT